MVRNSLAGRGRATSGKSQDYDPHDPPDIPDVTSLVLLGGGGNASVYRGDETAMRRPVAVKVLHTRMGARDTEQRRIFDAECENAGQVGRHAHAADIYRRGFAEDWPYIVMPFYTHGSLAARLKTRGPLPVGEALATCAGVATALQYAHTLGILHRDVKPENILGDSFGPPVLADFGISTDRDVATRTVHHAMTPAYAAPEVIEHGGGWPTSDVWSLAATLYALLAGRPPFYDPGQPDPRANLRAYAGPLPPIGRPDVPPEAGQVLARALIGQPDARTASARIFAEELNDCLRQLGRPPVPVGQDGQAENGTTTGMGHPGARFPGTQTAGPGPSTSGRPGSGQGGGGGQYAAGEQTGYLGTGSYRAYGTQAGGQPLTGAAYISGPSGGPGHVLAGGGPGHGLVTGRLDSASAYRVPSRPQDPPRRRWPKAALAGGGALLLIVIAVAVYALTGSRGGSPGAARGTAAPSAGSAASAATGAQSAGAAAPGDVTATLVTATSVRLTWTNTQPASQVLISLGAGVNVRVFPNRSPLTITGLDPARPYCFAVGYYLGLRGSAAQVAWSTVTTGACVRGGTPSS